MRKRMTGLAVAAALVLAASHAGAADQLIVDKKLLIKNNADTSKNKGGFPGEGRIDRAAERVPGIRRAADR
jgi:hypothetical protein